MNNSKFIRDVLRWHSTSFLLAGILAGSPIFSAQAGNNPSFDRSRLPIADLVYPNESEIDPNKAKMPLQPEVVAPNGAPNVVVVLLDDLGFGGPSTFGGPIQMPTLDRLASNGLSYNRFHTIALCSPTRVALKQGRNHHIVNMGSIPEIATGFPGNTARVPNFAAPIAEVLRLNGYNTAAFGKWHATLGGETTASGPQDRWPTRQGFEKFYGFIGAEENNWNPSLHDGVTNIEVNDDAGYQLSTDLSREAIEWVRQQQSITPEKPFFIYFAPPGVHSPHHVHKDWADKYIGEFDKGWDQVRDDTLKRQIDNHVVPKNTRLADKPRSVADWATLSDDQKKMYARQAEVFAGFVEFTDYEVGRLLDAIKELGVLDDTLVIYIAGDNGTSSEGNDTGNWNWMNMSNGRVETIEEQLEYYDAWGGPTTYPHMSVGWAIAFDAPFAYAKQVASDFGGTRNGAVVHWPNGFKAKGELREQFAHVIDIAPTILQATRIPEPEYVNGVKQIPMQGTSIAYSFDHADAAEQHTVQYFEVVGNRGIYSDGWLARVVVKAPWEPKKRYEITDDDGWQLYDTHTDFSLSNDLADQQPERLAAMKQQFLEEAIANHVLPLDDRLLERLLPQVAGRKSLMADRASLRLYPGTFGINENAFIDVKNRSTRTTAEILVSDRYNNEGVLIAQGGRFGGWAMFIEDGRPGYVYNNIGELTVLQSNQMLAEGTHQITVDIDYDGDGLGKGANISLGINGKSVASARLENTVLSRFSFDEGADIAKDRATPVLMRDIGPKRHSAYTGDLAHVTIEVQ